ncbi:hypothetical protein SRB5_42380 [Streptomyces sp. RB5]|uniref:Uncharacterized protein n=1 Tax=Streptomyces smaragdinus TaxID=2585196 RepID=A0A7K0CKS1_9ACTN|nr:hypothetical protein [Streptomyces smaragdinus]
MGEGYVRMTDTGTLPEGQPGNASGPEAPVLPDAAAAEQVAGFQAGLHAGYDGFPGREQTPADFGYADAGTGEGAAEEAARAISAKYANSVKVNGSSP